MSFRSLVLGVILSVLFAAPLYADDSVAEKPAEQSEPSSEAAVSDPLKKGKTGIESIDTLTVNEWDIPTEHNSLPLTMLFSIFPGGGQYYTGHYVRGGFITGIEAFLFYEVYFNKSYQKDRVLKQTRPFQDSVALYTRLLARAERDSIPSLQKKRNQFINRVREKSDKKKEQEDLRIAENAWLLGVHIYGMFDAFGIWWNNNHRSVELRSMKTAILWGLLPGGGQIYNGEFGKAGLLYMGLMGAATSIWTSQKMVNYYVDRKHVMEAEDPTSEDYDRVAERLTYFRKNRNQYIWGIVLIYLYSIGDAAVDALLSDFDNPVHLAVLPDLVSRGAQALVTLDF